MASENVSIKCLNDQIVTQSPKKYDKTLHCAIVTKSPLKPTRVGGRMFAMTLCEEALSFSIRAICFDDKMFDKFEPTKTYDMICVKINKGPSTSNTEVIIDHTMVVRESKHQFELGKHIFTIVEILTRKVEGCRFLEVVAKIVSINDPCIVGKHPNTIPERDIHLADQTGLITLVLWRDRAIQFNYAVGDVIKLENAVTTNFNKQILLSTSFESVITKEDVDMQVLPTSSSLPSRKGGLISEVQSNVVGIKNFKSSRKCISCRSDISASGLDANVSELMKCQACDATFLAKSTTLSNDCMILLSYNHQWYSATTGVILHLFGWDAPRSQPSDHDLLCILKSTFLMRLDFERKLIVHVSMEEEKNSEKISKRLKLQQVDDITPEKEAELLMDTSKLMEKEKAE